MEVGVYDVGLCVLYFVDVVIVKYVVVFIVDFDFYVVYWFVVIDDCVIVCGL